MAVGANLGSISLNVVEPIKENVLENNNISNEKK